MSKPQGLLALLAATLVAALTLNACGGIPGNAVVSVNGKPITKAAFDHWMGVAATSSNPAASSGSAVRPVVPDPPSYSKCVAHLQATQPKPAKGQPPLTPAALKGQCEQQYTAFKQEVLGFLISTEWVFGEAAEQDVKVSDQEVVKQFNQLRRQQFPKEGEYQKFLAQSGQTTSDVLLHVKLNLLSSKIQKKITEKAGKKPSQQEISQYYEQHRQQFGQPERRNLLVILTKTQHQAETARSEIQSGKSFASVAKKSSIDPVSKSAGGSLPSVVKGQETKPLDEAAFKAKPNTLTGPVKTPFGYYIFEVKKVLPASRQSLAQVQSSIQQQLMAQRQQKTLSEFIKNFRTKWKARTECRKQYTVQDCKGYKEPKMPVVPRAPVAPPQTSGAAPRTPTVPATTGRK